MRRIALITCILTALLGLSVPAGATTGPRTVLIVGDSLTFESARQIRAQFPATWTVVIRAQAGSAACDWGPWISEEVAVHPDVSVVAVESVGNVGCAPGTPGSAEWLASTRSQFADLRALIPAAAHALFVVPPAIAVSAGEQRRVDVAGLAAETGFEIRAQAVTAVSPQGWTATLPCLVGEGLLKGCGVVPPGAPAGYVVPAGQIAVRNPTDRLHFCPTTLSFVTGCSSSYSSGAVRYARAVGQIVKAAR